MQSIFRLPWASDHLAPKIAGTPPFEPPSTTPGMEIPVLKKFKRKCAATPDAHDMPHPDMKKQCFGNMSVQPSFRQPESPETASPVAAHEGGAATYKIPRDAQRDTRVEIKQETSLPCPRSKLQQAIENQINMQILMKHNELRLIDQELAKCQVALEQLRRCELLSAATSSSHPDSSISAGTGPAVSPPPGYSRPPHPAPHGVVDGPYTHLYRNWLVHDPQFDAQPTFATSPVDYAYGMANRSTRNNGISRKSVARSITTPAKYADPLQSLPNYPTPPVKKDKSAPLVLRRSTDGKMVKLVCNNCNRGDMSSIQGFLNHCRIAHKMIYESHDAAAVDCGRVLDDQEIANLPTDMPTAPILKPTPKQASARPLTISMPASARHPAAVHPLNLPNAPRPVSNVGTVKRKASRPAPTASLTANKPGLSASTPLNPSSAVPRLSALFAKHNFGGDLEQAAASARQRVDTGLDDSIFSPSPNTPDSPAAHTPTGHFNHRGILAGKPAHADRPVSRKGYRQPAQQDPRPSSLAPVPSKHDHHEIPESPQDHTTNLSPHTADSNPGLVSDVEDDDNGSASEEETGAPHSTIPPPLPVGRDCSENMDLAVTVDDDIDEHGVVIRRHSMLATDEASLRAVGGPSRKLGSSKRV